MVLFWFICNEHFKKEVIYTRLKKKWMQTTEYSPSPNWKPSGIQELILDWLNYDSQNLSCQKECYTKHNNHLKIILIHPRSFGRYVCLVQSSRSSFLLIFNCLIFMKAYYFLLRVDHVFCAQQLGLNLPYMKTPPADQGKVLTQFDRSWRISVLYFCAYVSLR